MQKRLLVDAKIDFKQVSYTCSNEDHRQNAKSAPVEGNLLEVNTEFTTADKFASTSKRRLRRIFRKKKKDKSDQLISSATTFTMSYYDELKTAESFKPSLRWIIKNLDLQIKSGEIVAFVGASGCGKSTLARLCMRFDDVTEGVLYVDNT